MIVRCPCCEYETQEPGPDWLDPLEEVDEICEACSREWYRDEAAAP